MGEPAMSWCLRVLATLLVVHVALAKDSVAFMTAAKFGSVTRMPLISPFVDHHTDITLAAFARTQLYPEDSCLTSIVSDANTEQDNRAMTYLPAAHFDRTGAKSSAEAFIDSRYYLRTQIELVELHGRSEPEIALRALGRALHALQDFYAHSNYYGFPFFLRDFERTHAEVALFDAAVAPPMALRLTWFNPQFEADPIDLHENYPHNIWAKDFTFTDAQKLLNVAARTRATDASANLLTRLRSFFGDLSNLCSPREKTVNPVGSLDPNDKVGADGVGSARFVASGIATHYAIFFENLATATAPAQLVVLQDELSPSKYDLDTFSLGPISFGGNTVTPPSGLSSFSTTVDLRPEQQLLVRLEVVLEKMTGLLTVRLQSLDPASGLPPADPLVGHLPPNRVAPEGQGSVLFSLSTRPALVTGTEIRNYASIVFDSNPPIITPEWLNTIDRDSPSSQMVPLPSSQPSSFTVSWGGTDVGAGIRDFTVYVSDNGGSFTEFVTNTPAGSAVFTGQSGHAYAFYSLARDRAGNLESSKSSPEAVTVVTDAVSSFRRYFAEGATSSLFDTQFALLNPGALGTTATFTFTQTGAAPIVKQVEVPARTRATLNAKTVVGLATAEFATQVDSDQRLVVDRTMTWDASGYGAHTETAVPAPAPVWYLAEGATHSGFDLFYLLQNPSPTTRSVRVRYLRPAETPLDKTYELPPNSRNNIWVDVEEFPGLGRALADTDVSAVIESLDSVPIIVERAMYRSNQGRTFNAGHESAGITTPALRWFLAEGATGSYFDLFVLLANPNAADAQATVTYLLPDGTQYTKAMTVPANSRQNIWVDVETPDGATGFPLADTAVSTTVEVTNGVPIIVERSMWWPGDSSTWHEAHNSPGATETGTRWALAAGEVGGPSGQETYILLANTSAYAGEARTTLMFEDGTSATRTFAVAASSRLNIAIAHEFPEAAGRRFGSVIESVGDRPAQIVVERAMYANAGGVTWAAGTNALATKLQ
jgi:hypothetical protein